MLQGKFVRRSSKIHAVAGQAFPFARIMVGASEAYALQFLRLPRRLGEVVGPNQAARRGRVCLTNERADAGRFRPRPGRC